MTWLARLAALVHPRHQPIDQDQIRDEMTRDDPDFARIRQAQHDALQALTARRLADGIAIHQERRFWERTGPPIPPEPPADG